MSESAAADLLKQHIHLLHHNKGVVLDLACGKGQNGLFLKEQNISTLFADINQEQLTAISSNPNVTLNNCWHADFESEYSSDAYSLNKMQLQGIVVFKYLHRPLFPHIKQAINPGGLIIYETFTEANRQFGRPNRSDFLLKKGELKAIFDDWEIVFYFEGIKHQPDRAIAQIVARKPL